LLIALAWRRVSAVMCNDYRIRRVKSLKAGQRIPRILVVEDNDESRNLLVELLKIIKFEVLSAKNGREAVEVFDAYRPDFIWMDMQMPIMDGPEAAREIKALEQGKNVKIVALSAHVFGEKKYVSLSGFDDFISKPYLESDIYNTMSKHLNIEYEYYDS
jgi:CheY-like chemotaxis protein